MSARLATNILIGALIRQVGKAGGFAMILHKGDPISGAILIQCLENGRETGLLERVPDYEGAYQLIPCGPAPDAPRDDVTQYIARRRRSDPDIWLVELDIADAERLAAQILC